MQQQVREPVGRFSHCSKCDIEPRHIVHSGRHQDDTMKFQVKAIRHSLECRCGRSTGLHDTLDAADDQWGKKYSQLAINFRELRIRRAARSANKRSKGVAHG